MRILLALLFVSVWATPAIAEAPVNPRYLPQAEQEAWAERLATAKARIETLREKEEELAAEEAQADRLRYPRGEPLLELKEELRETRASLVEAKAALPRLVEEARRSGVLPEVLRPYR